MMRQMNAGLGAITRSFTTTIGSVNRTVEMATKYYFDDCVIKVPSDGSEPHWDWSSTKCTTDELRFYGVRL